MRRRGIAFGLFFRSALAAGASVLAIGLVWADPNVCKVSVCWINQEAKEEYECSEDCYFEDNPLDSSPQAQCEALSEHELDVEYMYRDTSTDTSGVGCDGGCITIGIGNKFDSVEDAVALLGSFSIRDENGELREATEQEIRDEFDNLPKQPANCSNDATGSCYSYNHWSSRTDLVLSDEARNGLCQGRLGDEFIPGLVGIYGQEAWDNMPSQVQRALVDMVYNLGVGGLRNGWPNFNRAIRSQDWATAAVQSNRPQLSDERNTYVRELFEAAEEAKQAAIERLAQCPDAGP